jgi:hypothetical protein
MNTKQLYRALCASSFDGNSRTVVFYCMAVNRGDAMEQAVTDEDPELGGPFYGQPADIRECTFAEMAAHIHAQGAVQFPEGDWHATDETMEALKDWLFDDAPCTETMDVFAEAHT